MRFIVAAAVAAACAGMPVAAPAQTSTVQLVPADPDRWDIAVHAGRHGNRRADLEPEWDRWYDSGSVALSAGFFVTPHLKVEGDVGRSADATLYVTEPYAVPGLPYPYHRAREHRFQSTSGSGALVYQFFRNQWFHPFAGAGVQFQHERQRADALPAAGEIRGPSGVVVPVLPPLPAVDATRTSARPYVTTGFKVYVSSRAFFRTDLRVAVDRGGAESTTWRAGVGVDF